MKQIPFDILIQKTYEFMFENELTDLPKTFTSNTEGVWSKICILCLDIDDKKAKLNIYQNWQRNSKGYKTKVLSKLNNELIEELPETNETLLDESESEVSEINKKTLFLRHISSKNSYRG
jgi:hypothetical protein